jgi:HEAT repeat protein
MSYARIGKIHLLTSSIALVYACIAAFGYSMSFQSIEVQNQQLKSAQQRLLQNPHDKQALSVILKMLRKDTNTVARSNAAITLGDLGVHIGPYIKADAVPHLIYALDKDNIFVRHRAACALKQFGPLAKDAIPVLRKSLVPSDNDVAWCSAQALGVMGEIAGDAVPDLLKVIKDNESHFSIDRTSITEFAIEALGGIGPGAITAIPDLESLLNHQSPYVRIFVSVALIQIDQSSQKSIDALETLLQDKDVEVRRKTIWSLKDIGVKAKPAMNLIKAAYLKDSDASVSSTASDLLFLLNKH